VIYGDTNTDADHKTYNTEIAEMTDEPMRVSTIETRDIGSYETEPCKAGDKRVARGDPSSVTTEKKPCAAKAEPCDTKDDLLKWPGVLQGT
jgi:hypothetical protein